MNLRAYAKGKLCTIRENGICNADPLTTVLAHWRQVDISGAGLKASDLLAAFACSACHDYVDGRTHKNIAREVRELAHLRGIMRTQEWLLQHGMVSLKGERVPVIERLPKIVPRRMA